ncbi:MAG: hypothetical protein L0387_45485 [Acidobacteria bacterium]|nr:hypothetical protein [Acidobacteriota bacterium]MCI0717936.1 hypothetical protein [Acidobacteriota bacterium]
MSAKSGSGKSFLLNFLITFLQKYAPYTFIFEMGGSYRSLTEMFGGSYLQVSFETQSFSINPFCLPPSRDNLNFLFAGAPTGGAAILHAPEVTANPASVG